MGRSDSKKKTSVQGREISFFCEILLGTSPGCIINDASNLGIPVPNLQFLVKTSPESCIQKIGCISYPSLLRKKKWSTQIMKVIRPSNLSRIRQQRLHLPMQTIRSYFSIHERIYVSCTFMIINVIFQFGHLYAQIEMQIHLSTRTLLPL